MIEFDEITAILVTRGDVDLRPIIASLPYGELMIYDNSRRDDQGTYGRYATIEEASNPVIYVQDDDVLVSCHEQLRDAYRPGVLTCNYPEPWDIPWVSHGALFDWLLPELAFDRYLAAHPRDRFFTHYACDGIFALLTENVNVVDYGSVDLPQHFWPNRVATHAGWYGDRRPMIQRRCAALKAAV